MNLTNHYFNVLKDLEVIQEEYSLTGEYDKTKYAIGFKNFIFSELIALNVPYQTIKDIELESEEFDYLVITAPDGTKHKCRRKFISSTPTPVPAPTSQAQAGGGMSFSEKKAIIENTIPTTNPTVKPQPVIEKKEPIPVTIPEPIIEPIAEPVPDAVEPPIIEEPVVEPIPELVIEPTIPQPNPQLTETIGFYQTDKNIMTHNIADKSNANYYKSVNEGKTTASIPYNDLTLDMKDITIVNPINHTSSIVNLTVAPLSVEDDGKSEVLVFAEGLSNEPILTYSTRENLTAIIEHQDEKIGIIGNWKDEVFGTEVLPLSNSTVDFSPEDELRLQNKKHEIGHCVVEINTPSNKKVKVHAFPISGSNNEKGTADTMLCIISEDGYNTQHLNANKPIYKLYGPDFEAKIMAYWDSDFQLSVEVVAK